MSRKNSKRRSPFVVTVAVAASAAACGGSVNSDGLNGGNGGTGSSVGSGGGISNPPPPKPPKVPCPAPAPAQNTACSSVGQSCNYKTTDECGSEVSTNAVCAPDGRWDVTYSGPSVSCNPPPPPVDFCPTSEPTAGQWCNVVEKKFCSYPAPCCAREYHCVDETWVEVTLECNPPPVECSPTAPKTGDSCQACGQTFSPCEYNECATGGSITYAECFGGTWTAKKAPCPG